MFAPYCSRCSGDRKGAKLLPVPGPRVPWMPASGLALVLPASHPPGPPHGRAFILLPASCSDSFHPRSSSQSPRARSGQLLVLANRAFLRHSGSRQFMHICGCPHITMIIGCVATRPEYSLTAPSQLAGTVHTSRKQESDPPGGLREGDSPAPTVGALASVP